MKVCVPRFREALEPWLPMWRVLPLANPFSNWEFARHGLAAPLVEPFIMLAQGDEGTLLGPANWSMRRKRGGFRLQEGIWGYDAWYHDPWIADPAQEQAISEAWVEEIRRHRKDWDALDLIVNAAYSPQLVDRLYDLSRGFTTRPDDRQSRLADLGDNWGPTGRVDPRTCAVRCAQRSASWTQLRCATSRGIVRPSRRWWITRFGFRRGAGVPNTSAIAGTRRFAISPRGASHAESWPPTPSRSGTS